MEGVSTSHQSFDGRVHRELILSMIDRGRAPVLGELAAALESSVPDVIQALTRLEANHGYVPHPGSVDAWVIHPFSTTPTLFHVANSVRGWWAPCIWCALGVGCLVEGPVTITTVLGGETDQVRIGFDGSTVDRPDLITHFPIPVARAWDNVHRHCAATLLFAADAEVDAWCARHGIGRGEVVPLQQVADLARAWYGGHLDPGWVKPSAAEAQQVFAAVGLTADHWQVPGEQERF